MGSGVWLHKEEGSLIEKREGTVLGVGLGHGKSRSLCILLGGGCVLVFCLFEGGGCSEGRGVSRDCHLSITFWSSLRPNLW